MILWRTVFISTEFEVADHSPCLRYICGQRSRVLISATYLEAEQSAPLHCMCPSGEEHSSPLHLWKQSTALLSAAPMEVEHRSLLCCICSSGVRCTPLHVEWSTMSCNTCVRLCRSGAVSILKHNVLYQMFSDSWQKYLRSLHPRSFYHEYNTLTHTILTMHLARP